MSIEILKAILLKGICILSFLIGLFLIVCALVNPIKLIGNILNESNFKNKQKYIYSKRLLFLIIGLIFVANTLLFFFKIINKSDFALIFAII